MKFFLIALASFLATAAPIFAADSSQSPSFVKLQDALSFIDDALDKEDWSGLTKALYPPFQEGDPNDPNRNNWKQLKEERGKLRLAKVFANRVFPTTDDSFDIGATSAVGSPLVGWSRIRFIKSEGGWRLNAIYGIR